MSKLVESQWMKHPGGEESRMWRLRGAPLWEPSRLSAVRRGVAWLLRARRQA